MTAVLLIGIFTTCNKDVAVAGVKLDETSFTIGIGETKALIVTVLPEKATNKTVVWTSSNPLVATVLPSGLVTAISKGEATIEVATADGNFTASCKVIVGDVAVTGITLNKTSLSLEVDGTETLTATILPENATNKVVIWTTTDPLIAIVVNGFVTAIEKGETTITATTFEGNFKATCAVMVGYKLPILTTLEATGIIHNKATLGGNITDVGFSAYSEKGICFSTTHNPTINDTKIIVSGSETGNYTSEATDLSDNTTYYVRAFATNVLGTAYGQQISFTTTDFSQRASVRFDVQYTFMGLLSAMRIMNSANVELVSYAFDGIEISPYFDIPSGSHRLYWYQDGSPLGPPTWRPCFFNAAPYNFNAGIKYTVVCKSQDGTQDPVFSVTNDGPR